MINATEAELKSNEVTIGDDSGEVNQNHLMQVA